ncbi:hypothetical protein RS9917_11196 [Synechococcus sp. RS9917]|nr:hypothetical protein RS9917_11196 [Synechococcus sp. RS9917]
MALNGDDGQGTELSRGQWSLTTASTMGPGSTAEQVGTQA